MLGCENGRQTHQFSFSSQNQRCVFSVSCSMMRLGLRKLIGFTDNHEDAVALRREAEIAHSQGRLIEYHSVS